MKDIIEEIHAIHRAVGRGQIPAGEGYSVSLRRDYRASIEDVWDAITTAERLHRWFLPVTGDLRLGGKYELEGNAGGEILHCEPPHRLAVTWVYGENPTETDISEVEVRLSSGDQPGITTLALVHTAVVPDERWSEFGPGAVGVGWDLTLLGLTMFLAGESIDDPEERAKIAFTPEGQQFMVESSKAWGAAHEAAGASAAEAASAAENTKNFYVPG
jgi:uncharacterized protein YndB with AHSA1/START domain